MSDDDYGDLEFDAVQFDRLVTQGITSATRASQTAAPRSSQPSVAPANARAGPSKPTARLVRRQPSPINEDSFPDIVCLPNGVGYRIEQPTEPTGPRHVAADVRISTDTSKLQRRLQAAEQQSAALKAQLEKVKQEKQAKDGESATLRRQLDKDQHERDAREQNMRDEVARLTDQVADLQRQNRAQDEAAATDAAFRRNEAESVRARARMRNGAMANGSMSIVQSQRMNGTSPKRRGPVETVSPNASTSRSRIGKAPRALAEETPAIAASAKGKGRANGATSPLNGRAAAPETPDAMSEDGVLDSDDELFLDPYSHDLGRDAGGRTANGADGVQIMHTLFRHEVPPWPDPGEGVVLRTPTVDKLLRTSYSKPAHIDEDAFAALLAQLQTLTRALLLSLRSSDLDVRPTMPTLDDPAVASSGKALLDLLEGLLELGQAEPVYDVLSLVVSLLCALTKPFGRFFLRRRRRGEVAGEDQPVRLLALVGRVLERYSVRRTGKLDPRHRRMIVESCLQIVELLAREQDDLYLVELADGLSKAGITMHLLQGDLPSYLLTRMLDVLITLAGSSSLFRILVTTRGVPGLDAVPGLQPRLPLVERLAVLIHWSGPPTPPKSVVQTVSTTRQRREVASSTAPAIDEPPVGWPPPTPDEQVSVHYAALALLHGLTYAHQPDGLNMLLTSHFMIARLISRISIDVHKLYESDGESFRGPRRLSLRRTILRLSLAFRLLYYFAEAPYSDIDLADLVSKTALMVVGTQEMFSSAFYYLGTGELPDWMDKQSDEAKALEDLFVPASYLQELVDPEEAEDDDAPGNDNATGADAPGDVSRDPMVVDPMLGDDETQEAD